MSDLERLNSLESAAANLSEAAESTKDVPKMRRVIELLEEAVDVAPIESARHGMAVINLCSAFGTLYRWTGDEEGWKRAVNTARQWGESEINDWRAPLYLLASAVLSYHRAFADDREEVLTAAINGLEAVRTLVPPGAGVYCTSSSLLADLQLYKYERTWDVEALEAALENAAEVADAPRARSGEKRMSLRILGRGLILRYEALDSVGDLDAAIDVISTGLNATDGARHRAPLLELSAMAFRHRFGVLGNPADLEASINARREMMEVASDVGRALALNNYSNGLADRYRLTHDLSDLDQAIEASRAAVGLLPADDAQLALVLRNTGRTLLDRYGATRDLADLTEAHGLLSRALAAPTPDLDTLVRLHVALGEAKLHLAATSEGPHALVSDAIDHFAKARESAKRLGLYWLAAGFMTRERSLSISDMEAGALLWLAELDPANAPELLRKTLEIGEAAKSWLLATELARRPLPQPVGVPAELLHNERWLLARLSALDRSEIGDLSWSGQVIASGRRKDLMNELESIWTEIEGTGLAGAHYVRMRRSPERAWLDALPQRERTTAVLSLLAIRDLRTGGDRERHGLVALAIGPGMAAPVVVAHEPQSDPVPAAARQFEAEVPGDGGHGLRKETWHLALSGLLGARTPLALAHARTIIVSPPRDGHDLPWHLVLQRAGWRTEDETPLAVATVPTLSILQPKPVADGARDDQQDPLLTPQMRYMTIHGPQEGMRLVLQMAGQWSGPLVVGNPTEDLPGAETEALEVAKLLGVEPLIGPKATVELVLRALYQAPIIHLAAHARFDEIHPLDSMIAVADGTIAARDLIGGYTDAEIIVLSACEGGTAQRVTGGEIAGLAHALLRAGAGTVLAALWPVDDDATAFLMAAFYRARQPGVGDAAAFAEAMRTTSKQPRWEHPYFWSGFVLLQGA